MEHNPSILSDPLAFAIKKMLRIQSMLSPPSSPDCAEDGAVSEGEAAL
jgi:hypothetical protein